MRVGRSIQKAIDEAQAGDLESAMMHACMAVDGTAGNVRQDILGNNLRFTTFIRDNYDIFGPMAAPGVNVHESRFPVKVERPKAPGGLPDIADVVYGIHRCCHGHGDALPDGFELMDDGPEVGLMRMHFERGSVRLSKSTIYGLLALAVLEPANAGETIPIDYRLTYNNQAFFIHDWWGKKDEFREVLKERDLPSVVLDFSEWARDAQEPKGVVAPSMVSNVQTGVSR